MKIKILQLNVWTGRLKDGLLRFFKNNDFDIICLQEAVWADNDNARTFVENFSTTVEQIEEVTGMRYKICGTNWGVNVANNTGKMLQGNVILSRVELKNARSRFIYNDYDDSTVFDKVNNNAYTVLQATTNSGIEILNYHGYWKKDPIGDGTTVEVMKRAIEELPKDNSVPVIMCGDLNVIHESPAMRELDFLHDLTYEYGVKSTLSGLKINLDVPCDHILVNDLVKVTNFTVVDEIVSDHKALVMEAEI